MRLSVSSILLFHADLLRHKGLYERGFTFLAIFLSLLVTDLLAQERPPIEIFTPDIYKAQNQNWSIAQNADDQIYVGNNEGLLRYNGSNWTLYQVPKKTPVRSLKIIEGKIYTGSFMDFGFWTESSTGQLTYTSISSELNLEMLEDEEFWGIEEINGLLLFQSFNRIYVINPGNNDYKIIESDAEITRMLKYDQTIFFQKDGLGIFTIENEQVIQKYTDEVFRNNRIIAMFDYQDRINFLTDNDGIHTLIDGKVVPSPINEKLELSSYGFYSAYVLRNGGLALGTISNGLLMINVEGELVSQFKGFDALSNNTVLSIFEDAQQNIWLGLDYGINCINMASQFMVYRDDEGDLGTVYSAVVHEGLLFIGTNQGLFHKKWESAEPFTLIDQTKGQVWKLKVIDELLFCGHNLGTFILKGEIIQNFIDREQGIWDFKSFPGSPELILQGGYNGLSVLEKSDGNWRFRNKIQGFDISSRFFEITENEIIVNHEFKGLYSLIVDDNLTEVKSFNRIPIEPGTGSNVLKFSGDLIYTSTEGIYRKEGELKFIRDSILSGILDPYEDLTTLLPVNGNTDMLWCYADENILFMEPGNVSDDPIAELVPITSNLRNIVAGFGNISELDNERLIIGTSYGYLILNRSLATPVETPDIRITGILSNQLDREMEYMSLETKPELENRVNNLRFEYAVPFYQSPIKTEFKYYLEGFNENWSDWTTTTFQEYENLPPGDYTFHVKGRIGTSETQNSASYSFVILPPWYMSNLMWIIYGLLVILAFVTINILYQRHYAKQRAKLIEDNQKKTALRELETRQTLIELKNETLEKDIENKNRELAISTMSLIKKNEFLNTIKGELLQRKDHTLSPVIKIIDRNLNNSDDWKFFEEAFNNADKDFLNKLKSKHSSLTSNDLRLCAYLRLNLSSKEIAPLLNISARSVEVKRYRLRKKMNLPHETNLTSYILEL